jgi:hypothetical protein
VSVGKTRVGSSSFQSYSIFLPYVAYHLGLCWDSALKSLTARALERRALSLFRNRAPLSPLSSLTARALELFSLFRKLFVRHGTCPGSCAAPHVYFSHVLMCHCACLPPSFSLVPRPKLYQILHTRVCVYVNPAYTCVREGELDLK